MDRKVTLKKIEVTNYRSCVSTSFEPSKDLSALIGPNGSGKTNLLSALQLLPALANSRHAYYSRRESVESFASDCVLQAWFSWEGKDIKLVSNISLVNNEKNQDEILSSTESWYMYSLTGSRKQLPLPMSLLTEAHLYFRKPHGEDGLLAYVKRGYSAEVDGRVVLGAMKDVIRFIKSISYYSASIFTNPSSCPISFEVESESGARRGISIAGHKKFLFDLYNTFKSDGDGFQRFVELVGPSGIGLVDKIEFREIESSSSIYKVAVGGRITTKEKKNNLIIPNFVISGNSFSPSQLSEGTFKSLALIFYLLTDKGGLMLIEEPEVCVHHGLLTSIIELIKAYCAEKQIIISTHSDQVLDSLSPESVYKVARGDDGTTVERITKSMDKSELEALRYYLRNEGGLGEYWKHGEL